MTFRAMTLATALLAAGCPDVMLAHGLVVFARAEGDEVVVEAKFANGRPALSGEVRVLDGDGRELSRFSLGPAWPLRFPIGREAASGLTIEVFAGDGHENYWILTPEDVAAGREANR